MAGTISAAFCSILPWLCWLMNMKQINHWIWTCFVEFQFYKLFEVKSRDCTYTENNILMEAK